MLRRLTYALAIAAMALGISAGRVACGRTGEMIIPTPQPGGATAPPAPTETPAPTYTPAPTDTPEPTATPVSAGLGVSRAVLQSKFEAAPFKMSFQDAPAGDQVATQK